MGATLTNSNISPKTQMRDAVIDRLFDLSENDSDIMFFTADMGAEALDKWRAKRKNQYRDVGIAEQGMASIAAGMAREGKHVFIYAIAPFVVSRIHEQHKINAGIQGLPYNTIGVGTGFCYSDSGPTHYNTEDISLMRAVPNMEILSPSDSVMAANLAEYACYSDKPSYLRLERSVLPIISDESDPLESGFREIKKGRDICIVSTGNMVHEALACSDELESEGINVGVIDIYRLKPVNMKGLAELMYKYTFAVSLEEHLLNGGLGSIISELITDLDLPLRLRRIGIDDQFTYFYKRQNIHRELAINKERVKDTILSTVNISQSPLSESKAEVLESTTD